MKFMCLNDLDTEIMKHISTNKNIKLSKKQLKYILYKI